MNIDQMLDGFEEICINILSSDEATVYMQVQLKTVREWAQEAGETVRPNLATFLRICDDVNENAIVVFSGHNLSLLVNDDGRLLEFA